LEIREAANTTASYTAFLAEHPTGPRSDDARAAIDDLAWNTSKGKNTVTDYNNYIQGHPNSRHVAEAKVAIDGLPVPYRAPEPVNGESKDEFQSEGEITTTSGCSVLDSKRSDGQPGLFFLSAPIDNPRDKGFDATGVGTLQKVGSGVSTSQNVGIVYVVGQVQNVNQSDLVIQWKGCGNASQQLLIHTSAASRICQGKVSLTVDRLNSGDKITAKVKTSAAPANVLLKAVIGGRTIRFRPFFQNHFVLLGEDFWDGKDTTCQ
jgi:hypothetical protein